MWGVRRIIDTLVGGEAWRRVGYLSGSLVHRADPAADFNRESHLVSSRCNMGR